jgi:tetratricopeptide (TPR) repeat protein
MLFGRLADSLAREGLELLQAGNHGTALTFLRLAACLSPSNAQFRYLAACAASELGARDKAARYCEQASILDPSVREPHELLSKLFLRGPGYHEVLQRIHEFLRPRTYVEIGVDKTDSIRLAGAETRCIGVDPAPTISSPLPPNVRIFSQTSDDFFLRNDVRKELGGLPVDLAFIDGLHLFDAALRDFVNLERLCHRGSTILVHDCFPHDARTAQRERATGFWTGDVWRLVVLLKRYRPDLSIHTIAAPPTGLCVVRNLDPDSEYLSRNLARITDEFMHFDYAFLRDDRARKLNLAPNEWSHVQRLLTSEKPRDAGATAR